jgi:putative transposase
MVLEQGVPVSRACRLLSLPRSQFYYSSKKDDSDIVDALQELAFKHPSYGFRKLFAYLRRSGKSWNHKKVYRVYKLLKLNKKRKGKRRLPARVKQPLQQQTSLNSSWSMDFMSDSLVGNRRFRTFNVTSKRIIRTLNRVIELRGMPKTVRSDNGPEFTSNDFELWCKDNGIHLQFIQPGKPMQNGFIERFNRLYREAVLDAYLFFDLDQVRQLTQEWIEEYNQRRPHEGLNNLTPEEWKYKVSKNEYLQ